MEEPEARPRHQPHCRRMPLVLHSQMLVEFHRIQCIGQHRCDRIQRLVNTSLLFKPALQRNPLISSPPRIVFGRCSSSSSISLCSFGEYDDASAETVTHDIKWQWTIHYYYNEFEERRSGRLPRARSCTLASLCLYLWSTSGSSAVAVYVTDDDLKEALQNRMWKSKKFPGSLISSLFLLRFDFICYIGIIIIVSFRQILFCFLRRI